MSSLPPHRRELPRRLSLKAVRHLPQPLAHHLKYKGDRRLVRCLVRVAFSARIDRVDAIAARLQARALDLAHTLAPILGQDEREERRALRVEEPRGAAGHTAAAAARRSVPSIQRDVAE